MVTPSVRLNRTELELNPWIKMILEYFRIADLNDSCWYAVCSRNKQLCYRIRGRRIDTRYDPEGGYPSHKPCLHHTYVRAQFEKSSKGPLLRAA
jgi:hypothetical protein